MLIIVNIGKELVEAIAQHPILLVDYVLGNNMQHTGNRILFHANVIHL